MKSTHCESRDIALKSFFLGPQAENGPWARRMVTQLFDRWFHWRRSNYPQDGRAITQADQESEEFKLRQERFEAALGELMTRFEQEIPKFSPRYIGHMFSEISLPALFGHLVALLHNPNNISRESARIGVQIETEALQALTKMIGYPETATGHFTSGGTIANFEALVRARNVSTDESVLLIPRHKHYSWIKGASLIQLPSSHVWEVALDEHGRLSMVDLRSRIQEAILKKLRVMMVVSVAGSTELGTFDPVNQVQDLLDDLKRDQGMKIWHHVDAAYGGFFATLDESSPVLSSFTRDAVKALRRADSVTLDPHKLGYVPYACGAFLARDPADYKLTSFGAPYVNFDEEQDRGLFTLEGSRGVTGAAATWMIARTTGLNSEGYGRILARSMQAKAELKVKLLASGLPIRLAPSDDSNLLCFHLAETGEKTSDSNRKTLGLLEEFSTRTNGDFFLSMTRLNQKNYGAYLKSFIAEWKGETDVPELVLGRICIMNPFFNSSETRIHYPDAFVLALTRAWKTR